MASDDAPLINQSAASSRDCALQWVSFALHDAGDGPEVQHDCLDPIEDQLRAALPTVMRDGLGVAVADGPNRAGRIVVERLKEAISYADVPDSHRDMVREQVDRRLDEKASHIAEMYDDMVTDVKHRAAVRSEAIFVDWGPVV